MPRDEYIEQIRKAIKNMTASQTRIALKFVFEQMTPRQRRDFYKCIEYAQSY